MNLGSDILLFLLIIGVSIIRRVIRQQPQNHSRRYKNKMPNQRKYAPEIPETYQPYDTFQDEEQQPEINIEKTDGTENGFDIEFPVPPDLSSEIIEKRRTTEKNSDGAGPETWFKNEQSIIRSVIMTEVLAPPKAKRNRRV